MQQQVMVRYGELFLKSESVMHHYIRILTRNIGRALEAAGLVYSIEEHRGRLFINCDDPARAAEAALVFGVVDTSVVIRTEPAMEAIAAAAVEHVTRSGRRNGSFAIRPRREGVKGFTSQELGSFVGSRILDVYPDFTVDLTNPEYEIFVEARHYGGFVSDYFYPGPKGLPLGTQGKAVCLISAGIDSPVAAWLMMRRGTELLLLHMNGGRYAGAATRDDSFAHAKTLSTHCMGTAIQFIEIDMEPFFSVLETLKEPRYRCVLCKRFMHRVASRIGEEYQCSAIVNGDNLGQVASQTLENLAAITPAATLPVLRPLITYDKEEIVTLAKKIGTFIARPGDHACRMVPKKPSIAVTIRVIEVEESKLPIGDLVEKAIQSAVQKTALSGSVIDC